MNGYQIPTGAKDENMVLAGNYFSAALGLSDYIWLKILGYLRTEDLLEMKQVNSHFDDLLETDSLYKRVTFNGPKKIDRFLNVLNHKQKAIRTITVEDPAMLDAVLKFAAECPNLKSFRIGDMLEQIDMLQISRVITNTKLNDIKLNHCWLTAMLEPDVVSNFEGLCYGFTPMREDWNEKMMLQISLSVLTLKRLRCTYVMNIRALFRILSYCLLLEKLYLSGKKSEVVDSRMLQGLLVLVRLKSLTIQLDVQATPLYWKAFFERPCAKNLRKLSLRGDCSQVYELVFDQCPHLEKLRLKATDDVTIGAFDLINKVGKCRHLKEVWLRCFELNNFIVGSYLLDLLLRPQFEKISGSVIIGRKKIYVI